MGSNVQVDFESFLCLLFQASYHQLKLPRVFCQHCFGRSVFLKTENGCIHKRASQNYRHWKKSWQTFEQNVWLIVACLLYFKLLVDNYWFSGKGNTSFICCKFLSFSQMDRLFFPSTMFHTADQGT